MPTLTEHLLPLQPDPAYTAALHTQSTPDEADDLLYDSRRDYLDQLQAYKHHRFGVAQ